MKYLKQITIIFIFTFVGELMSQTIPLPIPASIYGLLLLFVALCTGLIKLSWIEETGDFLVAIMPIMFVAPAVKIMDIWAEIKSDLFSIICVMILSSILVFAVSGKITEWIGGKKS